jgi:transposase
MPEALVSEGLWEVIGPLLPAESPKPKGGRLRVPGRVALEGIVYVLRSGIPWRMLPEEFGRSGVICWRRLRDWQEAGVWRRLRQALLDRLGQAGLIDWARASVDSASTPAKKGEEDRSQPGRSRQTRLETPPARRRERHAARRGAHRGPGPRLKDLRGVGRRRRASKGTKGTAQEAPREAARRQRL